VGNGQKRLQIVLRSTVYDVLVIQELPCSGLTGAPRYSRFEKYDMIFSSGRAVLYVSKRIDRITWTTDGGEDWAAVTFGKGDDVLTVISIYSELHNRNWKTLLKELIDKPPLRGRTVIVGDFNAYYPMWDRDRR